MFCPAAEIIKRRILGLHQNNQITSIAIQDTWEPIEVRTGRLHDAVHSHGMLLARFAAC